MQHDPTDYKAEARRKADEETQKRIATEQERDDYRWLLGDPRGRRIMWELLSSCGLYRTSFVHSGSQTAFNEGMRNIGLMLNDRVLTHAPETWIQMQSEAREGALNKS